jgi:hypothetical protein
LLFAQAGLECHLHIFASHDSWDDRCAPPHPAVGWDGVSQTICPGWPQTLILLTSASQIARIIGMSHWHLATWLILKQASLHLPSLWEKRVLTVHSLARGTESKRKDWLFCFEVASLSVAQADLKLVILLPLPPECWWYGVGR